MNLPDHRDSLDGLLQPAFAKPAELGAINLRVLSPFQRALLVIDGTVTKFIEAYTLEPVDILCVAQTMHSIGEEHRWLDVVEGSDVLLRQVVIEGRYSASVYVYAVSFVVTDRLPEEVRKRLEVQGEGLGRILEDLRVETRREVLWYGREHLDELPEVLRRRKLGEFISRGYRIITDGRPIALINERFPRVLDKSPSSV